MSSLCVVSVWSLKILSNHYAMIIRKKINSFLVSSTTQSAFKNFPVFPKMSVLQLIWVLGFFLNIIYVYTVCYSLCASYNIPLKSEMDIIEFILQLSRPDGAAGDWWSRDLPPPPRSCALVDWWLRFQGRSGSYQQFSEGFVWLPASSWAYHFPYTCYQKFLCKYLVIGHLVLEINWLQNQEA